MPLRQHVVAAVAQSTIDRSKQGLLVRLQPAALTGSLSISLAPLRFDSAVYKLNFLAPNYSDHLSIADLSGAAADVNTCISDSLAYNGPAMAMDK